MRAELREVVAGKLVLGCLLDQVAGRLRYECPGQHDWHVSHEAMYGWIGALPKGELGRLGVFLRSGRIERRSRGRVAASGVRIVGMRSIEECADGATDRRVPGHWEGI